MAADIALGDRPGQDPQGGPQRPSEMTGKMPASRQCGSIDDRMAGRKPRPSVLEAVLARLSGAGLLRAGGRQRTDSTHVLAAVRTLNRMEFAGETLRAALEALAAAPPAGWPR